MPKLNLKAHPIMMARLIKPYLFVLIIPLVRAIVQYFIKHEVDVLLPIEITLFAIVVVITVLGWLSIGISIENNRMTIKKGVLLKSYSVIDVSKISGISLTRNVFDYIFGSVSCSINTEAGRPRKNDFVVKIGISDANKLYNVVRGEEKMKTIKFSAFRIALLAATTSSAATGIIVGVPIINRASDLIGIAISDMLLNEINHVSSKFDNIFPPIVNTVTFILLFAYCVSAFISFVKNINFRLNSSKNSIEVKTGFLSRKKVVFRKSNINNVCIEQTPLMRILKKHSMRVSIGGYSDSKGIKAVMVPIADRAELEKHLKDHFQSLRKIKCILRPGQNKLNLYRLLLAPIAIALAVIGFTATAMIVFPYFDRLFLFLGLITMGVDVYYGTVCYRNYKKGQLYFGDCVFVSGSEKFTTRELYCEKSKVGIIRLLQTPADRKLNTCKIKITVRSENADSVKIKNVYADEALKQINEAYNLNLNV